MATNRPTVGPRVEIDGLKEYKQAISELNASNKTLSAELKRLQAEYKGNTDSTEYLTKKGELLQTQLDRQKEKVEQLRKAMQLSAKENGEASTKTQEFAASLARAETEVYRLEDAIEENNAALNGENETMLGLGDTVDSIAEKFGINLPDGLKESLNSMEGFSAGTVAAMAAAAAAVVAVIEAVKALHQMTLEAAHEVDELVTQSKITGMSTQTLQELSYAAELVDVSVETISGSMTKLTKNMADAQNGNEKLAAEFKALGVEIQNSDGSLRSAEEVFYDVIDALGEMENGTERDAAAMALMGKSAQELNPLILEGSQALRDLAEEAEATGYILDESQIKKLEEVDDAYQRMELQVDAFKKQLAADFAPASQATMELFTKAVQAASEALQKSGLIENLGTIISSVMSIGSSIIDLIGSIPGLDNVLKGLNYTLKGVALVIAAIADAAQVAVGLVQMLTGNISGGWSNVKSGLGMNLSEGQLSNTQRALGYDQMGSWYNPETGYWEGTGSQHATGTDNFSGGLTWVGENGPELAMLPAGTRILSAQESRDYSGGDVINITVDVGSLEDLDTLIRWAKGQKIRGRMR